MPGLMPMPPPNLKWKRGPTAKVVSSRAPMSGPAGRFVGFYEAGRGEPALMTQLRADCEHGNHEVADVNAAGEVRLGAVLLSLVAFHSSQLKHRDFTLHGQIVRDVGHAKAREDGQVVDREHGVVHRAAGANASTQRRSLGRVRVVATVGAERQRNAEERRDADWAAQLGGPGDAQGGVHDRPGAFARIWRRVVDVTDANQRADFGGELVGEE